MKHFKIYEFLHSDVAEKHQVSNYPSVEEFQTVLQNIIALVDNILDPLRERVGRPIIITSGYRSKRVNELVGGSIFSQHMKGKAADIYVQGYTPLQMEIVYYTIQMLYEFDQLILYPYKNIIHVSWNGDKNRNESWKKG